MYKNEIAMLILYGMTLSTTMKDAIAFVPHRMGGAGGIHNLNTKTSNSDAAFDLLPISRSHRCGFRSSLKANDRKTDDDDDEFEYARVRRRRGRQRYSDYDEDVDERSDTTGTDYNDVGRKRDMELENEYYDESEYDDKDEEYYDDDDDDDDDDYFDGIIPNIQLDQIDPDGAIDRVADLFKDPKFWRDSALVVIVALAVATDNPMEGIRVEDIDLTEFYAN